MNYARTTLAILITLVSAHAPIHAESDIENTVKNVLLCATAATGTYLLAKAGYSLAHNLIYGEPHHKTIERIHKTLESISTQHKAAVHAYAQSPQTITDEFKEAINISIEADIKEYKKEISKRSGSKSDKQELVDEYANPMRAYQIGSYKRIIKSQRTSLLAYDKQIAQQQMKLNARKELFEDQFFVDYHTKYAKLRTDLALWAKNLNTLELFVGTSPEIIQEKQHYQKNAGKTLAIFAVGAASMVMLSGIYAK